MGVLTEEPFTKEYTETKGEQIMDDLEVRNLQLELKKEVEEYLPHFLSVVSPGNECRVQSLLKAHDFCMITGLNARFSGVREIDSQWTMIKFYYGITVFNDDMPYLCNLG